MVVVPNAGESAMSCGAGSAYKRTLLVASAQEVHEILNLGDALWREVFELLDQRMGIASIHFVFVSKFAVNSVMALAPESAAFAVAGVYATLKMYKRRCSWRMNLKTLLWLVNWGIDLVEPGVRHWRILRALLAQTGTAGNLTTDAHIAALALEGGHTLCSADHDFRRFPGLRHFNPLAVSGKPKEGVLARG